MRKGAVIIDNRPSNQLSKVIDDHMKFLPDWELKYISDIPIRTAQDYNEILTDVKFWESLPYDKVLIFQHDSMILRPFDDYFLEYSYIGAPWKKNAPWNTLDRRGGNGGISLRDVKAHIELLKKVKYHSSMGNEDVFFSHKLDNVAPYEVCSKFGVETEYNLGTFSYHAIDKHLTGDQCYKIKTQYK